MSDPKDKLVLFKEILSLMIVTIGFITALMSSGLFKNIRIEPLTLVIIFCVIFFILQFVVRMVFGEEKYNEIKSKILSTARDFSIILLVIAGFYFAGKYAAGHNAAVSGGSSILKEVKEKEAEKSLSTVPLKNINKEKFVPEKSVPSVKSKEKMASKKPVGASLKAEMKSAVKPLSARPEKDNKPASIKNDDILKSKAVVSHNLSTIEPPAASTSVELKPIVEDKRVVEDKPAVEDKQVAEDRKFVYNKPALLVQESDSTKSVEAFVPAGKSKDASGTSVSVNPTGVSADSFEKNIERTSETVVITVVAPDDSPSGETVEPASVLLKSVAADVDEEKGPVINAGKNSELEEEPVDELIEETADAAGASESDEVLTFKMAAKDSDNRRTHENEAVTSVSFERTAEDMKERVNKDRVMIKKEYEIEKTPSGIKNAGDKVIEGGRKIIEGGAGLIEKAGKGIKNQIDKVIK